MTTKSEILNAVKNVIRGDEAQAYIEAAFDLMADTVVSTLGPNGCNVIYGGQTPHMTKDGVTVSNRIDVRDPILNSVIRLIKDGSRYSDTSVGDGTTTTMMMARAFYTLGKKLMVDYNLSPYQVKDVLIALNKQTLKYIGELTMPVRKGVHIDQELLSKVITTSVNGDTTMAAMVQEALLSVKDFDQLALDNVITVKKSTHTEDELEVVDGMHYRCGYQSAAAVNSAGERVEYKNALVVVYRDEFGDDTGTIINTINHLSQLAPLGRPVVLMAQKYSDRAINAFHNHQDLKARGLQLCLVRLPEHGDQQTRIVDDLTHVLKLQPLLSNDSGDELSSVKWLSGEIEQIVVTRNTTTFIPSQDVLTIEYNDHIEKLKESIELCRDDYDRGKLMERLQSLNGLMVTINVGGLTETERDERKDRFDDGVGAGRAAVLGGVVIGGGRTLNYIASQYSLESERDGFVTEYRRALDTPIKQLCLNSGIDDLAVIDNIIQTMAMDNKYTSSYDVVTNKHGVNLLDKGILDAAKVTESALIAGLSVAMSLLTTNVIMVAPQDI